MDHSTVDLSTTNVRGPTGMKTSLRAPAAAILCLSFIVLAGCQEHQSDPPAAASSLAATEGADEAARGGPAMSTEERGQRVARGKYLVTVGVCNDCHTPLKMGPSGPLPDEHRLLSGHPETLVMPAGPTGNQDWAWQGAATMTAFHGSWGTTFTPNLTPDMETGIGAWDEDLFIKTLRTGKIMGAGRPILPPMPWASFAQMTDDDLGAIFAYLQSIPPVRNQVPDYIPPAAQAGAVR
jgi:mono/diheme cytochrome c family protein